MHETEFVSFFLDEFLSKSTNLAISNLKSPEEIILEIVKCVGKSEVKV